MTSDLKGTVKLHLLILVSMVVSFSWYISTWTDFVLISYGLVCLAVFGRFIYLRGLSGTWHYISSHPQLLSHNFHLSQIRLGFLSLFWVFDSLVFFVIILIIQYWVIHFSISLRGVVRFFVSLILVV